MQFQLRSVHPIPLHMSKPKKPRNKPHRHAGPSGWSTSDADEIERRRLRGATEAMRIDPETADGGFYGRYRVRSGDGQHYRVEIRSLSEPINSCDCPDHRINGLGTCKHIEATLFRLQSRRKRAFRQAAATGSPFLEIFLDRRDRQVGIRWPRGGRRRSIAHGLLAPFFNDQDILRGAPLDALPALKRSVNASPARVRHRIRISGELNPWLEALDRDAQQQRARQHFETEVAAGRESLDLVRYPLYPYQQEGMLHLAFTGRALLADEMGLGKTVQAIAACELLRRTRDIRRVLVISPASLKGEWEEQIARFTDLPAQIIQGPRAQRLRQYEGGAFFFLANYEQVQSDANEINRRLAPDVIILDEAQRIKNWQTRTAISVKRLNSPYAFVLTGTPVENRIDEIYSIVQFLDPHLFGPLFRFNREFYQLDEKGRAVGYQNLDQLHARLQPVMLRRRKAEVEEQLPGRTINTYLVPMQKEQALRYGEYEAKAARLAATARRRALTKEEMDRLQRYLACMRMLCDTPYILDRTCRISPKLQELGELLEELMADGDHKIIIFSEWQRMLELVRELAEKTGLEYAWHTGQVTQLRRRAEIRRFKDDPECRLFLSTDSGATGLNLQVADVVINLDMPWNPARLEQRIARAWRKHQKRRVQVINLVSEHTIEHRMLTLLDQKRSLAEGVVDGTGGREMALPSGRAAFLERVQSLMTGSGSSQPPPSVDPLDRLRDEVLGTWGDRLDLMELHGTDEPRTLLVVANRLDDALQTALSRQLRDQFPDGTPKLQVLDRDTYRSVLQLIEAGVLHVDEDNVRTLHRAPATDRSVDDEHSRRLTEAREQLARGERKRQMANVLAAGGFPAEALAPMRDAVDASMQALTLWRGHHAETPPALDLIDATLVQTNLLPAGTLPLVARLRADQTSPDEAQARKLLAESDRLLAHAATLVSRP
jgi:superfamily II DNA or RNA helicase